MLSERRQRVLAALIEEYVARAMPVGSRTLTERYQLGVSPATVRNELSVLEEEGYLTQPHTSAGRIPTDFGYRAFVDDLLESEELAQLDERHAAVAEELRACASELDVLLERTSVALARLTDCLSIVLAPSVLNLHIKQLSLISLSPHRALIVVVTEDGQVLNRQLDFADAVSPDALARVQLLLSDSFVGRSLSEVEQGLGQGMAEAFSSPLVRYVLSEVLLCLQAGDVVRSRRLGMSSLLTQPEFSSSRSLVPLMRVLEDDTVLLQLLDETAGSDDELTVNIGHENPSEALSGVSVVASRYGRGESAGVVAVIGPTRMDYSRVIKAVRMASGALEDV